MDYETSPALRCQDIGECLAGPGTVLHVGKYKEERIYKEGTVGEANWSTSHHCTKCSVPGGEWGQLPRAL